jgi:hypothetical protein
MPGEEGNQYIRIPVGEGGGDKHVVIRVTAVPTLGRREYTGRILKFKTTGSPLTLTPKLPPGKEVKFFNMLEATNGTPFLAIDDEVVAFKHSKVYLCSEFPRGYV